MTICDRDNTTVYRVAAARDAVGADARPAAVVVRSGQIVSAGPVGEVMGGVDGATVVEMDDTLVLPALVNAHAHLDLTTLGPRPYQGEFADWLAGVIRQAPVGDSQVAQSVARGLAMMSAPSAAQLVTGMNYIAIMGIGGLYPVPIQTLLGHSA